MSLVRKSISPRSGVGSDITVSKVPDNYYGFNRLLELLQGSMGDSAWDALASDIRNGKKAGGTGGATTTGTGAITITRLVSTSASYNRIESTWGADKNATMPSGAEYGVAVVGAGCHCGSPSTHGARVLVNGATKHSMTGEGVVARYSAPTSAGDVWKIQIKSAHAGGAIYSIRFG